MKLFSCTLVGLIAFLAAEHSTANAQGAYTFSVLPAGGSIAGPANSTIGWGYSITNPSATQWLVITGLSAGTFVNGSPDSSYFDFPVIPPSTTVTVPFSSTAHAGLYGLVWDSAAPSGFVNTGTFTLVAEWWTGDPLGGGTFSTDAPDQNAAYSATAGAGSTPTPTSVPALPVWGMVALAGALAATGLRLLRQPGRG